MDRKLAAILAADVVGYSALMEADEAGTFARLKAGRKKLFEPEIARHHGRVFKIMGDGMLAEFGSVVDAVECAVALQRGLAERNAEFPEDQRIQVRIGINLGEVIVEGEDRYGEGVNIATRLEQLAEPGGICVSGKVAKEVEKKLAFGFEPMGEQKVKNISEPVTVFRVNLEGGAAAAGESVKTSAKLRLIAASVAAVLIAAGAAIYLITQRTEEIVPALLDRPSIAVLPFENLSDDPQQTYFADGIAEDVMTDLSRLSGIFVIARNSSFAYRGKAVDTRQVARELGVRYVLEGSVRRAADQIRINVQLIDGTTGAHQWAERYDGATSDIFALQDKVTSAVVAALALQLGSGEQLALLQHDTAVPQAYEAFLRGWEHYQRTTPEGYRKAIPEFERATELDPNYGRAHAALALVYFRTFDNLWSGSLGIESEEAFRKARDYLAVAQRHPTATSHQVAGNISRQRGWYEDAIKEFDAAIAIESNNSWIHADKAYALIWAGKPSEAEAEITKAVRLDPRTPPVFLFYRGLAQFTQDRFDDAARTFDEALRLNPDLPIAGLYLAASYGKMGRAKDAAASVAAYGASRVRQGGVPFIMFELQANFMQVYAQYPARTGLVDGLRRAGVPYDFRDKMFASLRLSGSDIDALFFGRRVHGRDLVFGWEHSMSISSDGASAISDGNWFNGSGRAYVRGDQLCIVATTTEYCYEAFRNPGGSRTTENEYFLADPWPYPFSQAD
jgi:TolB-like protein/class 3 adenylate cyclase/Flp pilus assembly protein TadD